MTRRVEHFIDDIPASSEHQNIVVFLKGEEVIRAFHIKHHQLYPGEPFRYSSTVQLGAVRLHSARVYSIEPGQPVPGAQSPAQW